MSKKSFLQRIPLAEARLRLLEIACRCDDETVNAEASAGRTTAQPVFARFAAPHYRASAMDGLAVRAGATQKASLQRPPVLGVKDVFPVDTGSPMPESCDAVIRIENVEQVETGYSIKTPVASGQDVRQIGEDMPAGSGLFGRGHVIRPADVGAMLATGVNSVAVVRRPRVATIATGDEIVEPGTNPEPGDVVEFNSRVLAAYVREWGGESDYRGKVGDDHRALVEALRSAVAQADIVCMIAGSSAGRKDLTAEVLSDCGRLLAHGIDIRPGKPTAIAEVNGTPVIGLPGYPVSAAIVCRELLRPLVARMLGRPPIEADTIDAEVRRQITSRLGVEEFLRVCLAWNGSGFVVAPLPRGAGSISTLVRADGLLRIAATCEGIERGRRVAVELLRPAAGLQRTIVVAGPSTKATVALEESLRRDGHFLRLSHLGAFSAHDAATAIETGQAHVSVSQGAESEEFAWPEGPTVRIAASEDSVILRMTRPFAETDNGRLLGETLASGTFLDALRALLENDAASVEIADS